MSMEKIVANLSGKVAKKTLAGKEYLVAPVTMLIEGVFAGNQGALFYDGAELAKSANAWNARPLMIGHPELPDGTKVSGCTPEAIESAGIGMILNTRWNKTKKKLVAEAWLDVERLRALPEGINIEDALNKGTPVEVSTGLFVDNEMVQGEYNGKQYVAKAKNFRPDHLAILLHEEGACSLKDGAGLLVNKGLVKPVDKNRYWLLVANSDTSLGDTISKVNDAVYAKYCKDPSGPCGVWVMEVYEDSVIYQAEDKLWRENFTMEDGSAILLENRIEVIREVTYEPVVPVTNTKVNMSKDTLTKALGDSHKDFVAGLTDAQVTAILSLQTPVTNAAEPKTIEEVVAKAPVSFQDTLKEALATNAARRKDLVDLIVANEKNTFTEQELLAMSTPSLDKLARLATNAKVEPAPAAPAAPVFAGQPAAPVTNAGAKVQEGFLPLSTY